MAVYVTSDLHLNHFSILEFEKSNLEKNGLSYIKDLYAYNEMIIKRINFVVRPQDTLYILGDFAFGGNEIVKDFVRRIHGHKILIKGNHDHYSVEEARRMGFEQVYDHPIYLPGTKGKVLLSHYPAKEALDNPYIVYNLHGHIHGGYLDLPNFKNVNIAMTEYYPVDIDSLINRINSSGKSREEPWLHEWYAPYQVFKNRYLDDVIVDSLGKIDLEKTKALKRDRQWL